MTGTTTGRSLREGRRQTLEALNNKNQPVASFLVESEFRLLERDDLPTPTTTVKDMPVCSCWDLHEAAAAEYGGEAIRRYIISGGDPGAEQWGNSPLHVRLIDRSSLLPKVPPLLCRSPNFCT